MFNKTVEGVRVFLDKILGKDKPNKEVDEVLNELPQERKDKIDARVEELKEQDGLMHMSKKGLADIVLSEAITLTKYKDSANVDTIGIGATRSEIKNLGSWSYTETLPIEDVFTIFTKGIEKYSKGIRDALKVEVSQHMFDGLVSFAYNVGIAGARNSSLMRAINRGVTDKKELKKYLMRWNKITVSGRKVVSKGLVNRRNDEAEVMFKGNYKNKAMVGLIIPVNKKSHRPMYRSKNVIKINLNKYL